MSNNKMLIDATHPEETRVVVLRDGRVEEFDYESAARKLLRGNIYLAKVTRVEPALQAAFIDYGGNRHGFLAFNEIHPDYYQIPMADRQALIEEEAAAEAEEEAAADARADALARRAGYGARDDGDSHFVESDSEPRDEDEHEAEPLPADTIALAAEPRGEIVTEPAPALSGGDGLNETLGASPNGGETGEGGVQEVDAGEAEPVEQVGSEDAMEELAARPRRRPRSYKIHEVIKRRQVVLVQVVKEERGNKGAALTTYLSLAGRYTVLMPNTGRGGGISRKITNPQDRKRLKAIAAELEVPEGMGLIIRTAGAARTKQEIKRDFEYLLRLWESVRELTLESSAPSLVYEEGNLIKRSIRDLYNKDVEDIIVAGGVAHAEARDFMAMLMPSHAKNVISYAEPEPLFTRFQIERQLNAMFSPYVTLRSGGYLVINQTEALVAVDVNSGKSTREFSIEETALNTNLEASDEIARQLKLRDLAGLIVIDFIDMEEKRNNRAVERRLKDALRFDRARIQVGRISHFGLMEMSRQRLRTGVLEGSTTQCAHCQGTGIIRSTESVALAVLRGVEDEILAGAHTPLIATATPAVALYILNNKRAFVIDMETRHGLPITVQGSDKMQGANFTIERGAAPLHAVRRPERSAVNMEWGFEGEDGEAPEELVAGTDELRDTGRAAPRDEDGAVSARDGGRRRGRRRRPRNGDWPENGASASVPREEHGGDGGAAGNFPDEPRASRDDEQPQVESAHDDGAEDSAPRAGDDDANPRRRRRGRRGGRRGRDRLAGEGPENGADPHVEHLDEAPAAANGEWDARPEALMDGESETNGAEPRVLEPVEATRAAPREPQFDAIAQSRGTDAAPIIPGFAPRHSRAGEAPLATPPVRDVPRASEARTERDLARPDEIAAGDEPANDAGEAAKPARKGWWQRKFEGS